jgi:hypothetical protein
LIRHDNSPYAPETGNYPLLSVLSNAFFFKSNPAGTPEKFRRVLKLSRGTFKNFGF